MGVTRRASPVLIVIQDPRLGLANAANDGFQALRELIGRARQQQLAMIEQPQQTAPAIDEGGDPRRVQPRGALEQELAHDVVEGVERGAEITVHW